MPIGRFLVVALITSYLCASYPSAMPQPAALKGRGVWAGPRDAGTTEESVIAFADQLAKAHVNTVILEFKGGAGLCWPSTQFADAVNPQYKTFDMPAILIRECHKRNIQVHAWFFDFAEGGDSYVARQHPEWLALNPEGKPTTSEVLRGSQYRLAWMCPARRPGYTDQWLIPVIKDFVQRYDVDAIHHDYVRYPGDLAPDRYCFCDYCLQHIPEYASYVSKSYPDRPFYPPIDRPHLEAHWEKGPRVLPGNWNDYSREMKSRFLLGGSFFPGGNHDLDYFFYEYRVEAVKRFVREVFEEVRRLKPRIEVSAAIFKDPVHSARFIGQDWRRFAPWVQYAMPMDYRSHYPGDFETHLDLLEESIGRQKEFAKDYSHLWIGIATSYLYDEEREPLTKIRQMLASGAAPAAGIRTEYEKVAAKLNQYAPELAAALRSFIADGKDAGAVQQKLQAFFSNVPPGFYPPEKLTRTMDRVRGTGVEGIVIFSAGGIRSAGLWDTVAKAFSGGM